jgi:hypothetical protein
LAVTRGRDGSQIAGETRRTARPDAAPVAATNC